MHPALFLLNNRQFPDVIEKERVGLGLERVTCGVRVCHPLCIPSLLSVGTPCVITTVAEIVIEDGKAQPVVRGDVADELLHVAELTELPDSRALRAGWLAAGT